MYSKEKILISLIGFTFLMVLIGNVNVAESATLVVDNVNPSSNCVDGGSAYQTIQSAVNRVGEGSTIIVCPGIYTENVYVHVCNRLTINSFSGDPSDTIVRAANPSDPVFYFSDSYCVEPYPSALAKGISGFTITGSNYVSGVPGIHVYCAKYGYISNNYISGNGSGIYMVDTYEFWDFYWDIEKNNIVSNNYGIVRGLGHGTHIYENNITSNNIGIYLYSTYDNIIDHNNIINNTTQALYGWPGSNQLVGNYWSDYTGIDDGSSGRTPGDGIGDTEIPHDNDNYPYMYSYGWLCSGDISKYPVRNVDTFVYYYKLQAAYDAAADGNTIQGRDIVFPEDLYFDLNKSVTLIGGYDCSYTVITGKTIINGNMTISNGTVTIENFILN